MEKLIIAIIILCILISLVKLFKRDKNEKIKENFTSKCWIENKEFPEVLQDSDNMEFANKPAQEVMVMAEVENPNKLVINKADFYSKLRRVAFFSNPSNNLARLEMSGTRLMISAQNIDYASSAKEELNCQYEGDDMQIGFNSRFLTEMLTNLQSDLIMLEMSLPNRAGILTPVDGLEEGETVTMLVMPVMLNN